VTLSQLNHLAQQKKKKQKRENQSANNSNLIIAISNQPQGIERLAAARVSGSSTGPQPQILKSKKKKK
jgi:hypothetical protein